MQNSNDVKPLNLQGQGDELRSEPIKILSKEELSGKDYITDFAILLGGVNVDGSGTIPNTSMTDVERLNLQQSEEYFFHIVEDEKTIKELEQAYLDDKVEKIVIDNENIPQDIADKQTSEILNDLFSKNQLFSRRVKYSAFPIEKLNEFVEYHYNDRKFTRHKALANNRYFEKDEIYWLEVKPINYDRVSSSGYTSETGKTR